MNAKVRAQQEREMVRARPPSNVKQTPGTVSSLFARQARQAQLLRNRKGFQARIHVGEDGY